MIKKVIIGAALAAACATAAQAQGPVTRTGAGPIASTVTVPAGYETVYFSGALPDGPAAGAQPLDAEGQSNNVFAKIGANLKAQGLTEADVVSMTIFMVAPEGQKMDFAGMMRAYSKFYGTPTQPNKPTRSTVQVAALASATALIEVEVTAVRKPK
jgi:enamine deaminase RidA (YjgF/YER057c/UK114 family)